MESKMHGYTNVRNAIHRMLEGSDVARGSSTEHSLCILEQKWNTVLAKMQERKVSGTAARPVSSQWKQHKNIQEHKGQDVLQRYVLYTCMDTKNIRTEHNIVDKYLKWTICKNNHLYAYITEREKHLHNSLHLWGIA